MKKLPQKTRLDFWKYQYADASFRDASEVATFLMKEDKHPLKYQLLTSLCVLYARSFVQHKSVRISDDLVPSEFMKLHNYLLVLRDKVFAHVDKNAPPNWNVKHLSKVTISYRDGVWKSGTIHMFRDGLQFEEIKELCDTLAEVCHSKSEDILADAMDGNALNSDLTYEVDLREGDRWLLKPRELEYKSCDLEFL